ncbi:MAG: carbamoyltransferase HypF, partial [Xanthomonadales bacterium]|nr:carbamoyltransferase HypF [Xanthomonadales bacterium]NIX12960.1 carbamoyltransferase HypF [Xanthomonadales bacterium]
VLHHHAHASALAGEHPDISGWLVFTWDGVGYGGDGTLWGGEALLGAPGRWKRVASFRPFKLVGGDKAGREPWRSAAALMWGEDRPWDPGVPGAQLAESAWRHDTGVHETSAAGRLFDAAAALVTGRKSASFEGQGPMELEALAGGTGKPLPLPLSEDDKGIWRADWAQLLTMLNDESIEPRQRAADFHASMAQSAIDQAMHLATGHRFEAVGLSGGVFQNRALSEAIRSGLAARGIDVRLHERVPANDGGLCFGQIIESLALSHSAAGEGMLRP